MSDQTAPIGLAPSLEAFAEGFGARLAERSDAHSSFEYEPPHFDDMLCLLRELQRDLFDSGWARDGGPELHGDSVLHRALMLDLMMRNGTMLRHCLEDLEIVSPVLTKYGQPPFVDELFQPTLSGVETGVAARGVQAWRP